MSRLRGVLFILILGAGCLGLAMLANWFLGIPERASQTFGPPADDLSISQRYQLAFLLLFNIDDLTTPSTENGQDVMFRIEPGESTASIIRRLSQVGLITNATAFRTYLVYSGLDTTLQAGEYQLNGTMTPFQIAGRLQDRTSNVVPFNILAGWRVEEIAAALPTSGLAISRDEFLQAVHTRPLGYSFSSQLPTPPTLEGFLLPGEYLVPRNLSPEGLVFTLLNRFEAQTAGPIREGFQAQGLTVYEAVTLAAIVEREAVLADEMPQIASVYLNRIARGMKLDADPTVQYALGFDPAWGSYWKAPLKLSDLEIISPFNTYLHTGLPPGPIANPGLDALHAVAFPESTPYLYFRAACDGSGRHVFAETFEEHKNYACP